MPANNILQNFRRARESPSNCAVRATDEGSRRGSSDKICLICARRLLNPLTNLGCVGSGQGCVFRELRLQGAGSARRAARVGRPDKWQHETGVDTSLIGAANRSAATGVLQVLRVPGGAFCVSAHRHGRPVNARRQEVDGLAFCVGPSDLTPDPFPPRKPRP